MLPDAGDGGRLARIEHRLEADDVELAEAFRRWRVSPDHDADQAGPAGDTALPPWVVVTLLVGMLAAVAGWVPVLAAAILGGWWVYQSAHDRPLWPDAARPEAAAAPHDPWRQHRPGPGGWRL
ncbi:DUF3040 domain-containing protein [Pseudonocardia bannensis]|uniref:DUF3040 domain-containing protein n=1 Tax=Pseudonocardia bannensis TaxID=630973 RepID=A0A848DRS4_9PSEU|nr:DUF3040 domain-containing protein [Pseudonocardia bannensis]NMH94964.1 DUF3040 domain-containing protein [Pseudonocardia bannensis]